MKPKQIVILALVFAVLLAGVFFKEIRKPKQITGNGYESVRMAVSPFKTSRIEIAQGKDVLVELIQDNKRQWRIPALWNARADQQKIRQLFSRLSAVRGELRGNDASLFKDFGLEEDKALQLRFADTKGEIYQTILINPKKPDIKHTFIRLAGSNKSYFASTDFLTLIGSLGSEPTKPNPEFWADLTLLNAEMPDIVKIQTWRGDKPALGLELVPSKDPAIKEWKYLQNQSQEPAQEKADGFLGALLSARASRLLNPQDYVFLKPVWRMSVTLANGKTIQLKAVIKDKTVKTYAVQVSTEPAIFELSPYYFDNLNSEDSKFLPGAAQPDPEA